MSPDQRSDRTTDPRTSCTNCGGPLNGNTIRCPSCVEAATTACRERAPGQSILPGDIAAIRARAGLTRDG